MENIMNLNDVFFNYYFMIGGLFLSYLIYRILHGSFSNNIYVHTKYKTKGHTWRSIQCNKSIPYNIYCTICGKLMLSLVGLFCECCAVSSCKSCCRSVDKKFKCKAISWPSDKLFYHHWVNVGNAQTANADANDEGLKKFFCCWCQKTKVCYRRTLNESEVCNFQKYRDIIIPPTCVQLENGIIRIKPLLDENWEPLIIFANRKSGSNRSDEVLSLFRGLLNPIQVIDISTTSPESVVRWLPPRCRILAAGGDGTVAWILNTLLAAGHYKAAVGILPMGTGNDLSRVMGWGPGCSSDLDAHSIITSIKQANEQPLDRWKVTIKPRRGRLGRARPDRVLYAYNYASIGVDAQVALDFHRARSQFLYRFASRTLNYAAYAFLGAGRAWDAGACGDLERRLRVRVEGGAGGGAGGTGGGACDTGGGAGGTGGGAGGTGSGIGAWSELSLPPLQALVALNIPSWGAGVDLWSMGNDEEVDEQRVDDGKLEVVGISSSIHIARLQCGLAEPYRFTQATRVKIELDGTCAMQVDGEPWMQGPATVNIEHAGQCLLLRAASRSDGT